MDNQISFTNDKAELSLQKRLAGAAAHLRAAESSAMRSRLISRTFLIAAITLGVIAVEILAAHFTGIGAKTLPRTVLMGAILVLADLARGIFVHKDIDWPALAQRLDLTVRNHNAIATALDLIRSGDRSEMAGLAIMDGLHVAKSFGDIKPALPAAASVKNLPLLLGGVVIVALAYVIVPMTVSHVHPTQPKVAALQVNSSAMPAAIPVLPASNDPANTRIPNAVPTLPGMPANPTGSNEEHSQKPGSADASPGAMQSPSTEGNAGDAPSARPQSSDPAKAKQISPVAPAFTDSAEHQLQISSQGSSSPNASASSKSTAAGGGGGDSKPSPEPASTAADTNPQTSGRDAKSPPDQMRPGVGGDGESGAKKSTNPGQKGGHGSNLPAADASGNGQASGQNAPKKSRGVAPLMLGTLQPDVVQSRQLPGPDEHTDVQIPPRAASESRAQSKTADPQVTDAPPVDVYHVPADSRRTVNEYLEQYHQQSNPASN